MGFEDRFTFAPVQDRPRVTRDPLRKVREKLQARLAEQVAFAKEIQKNPAKEQERQKGLFFWGVENGYAIEPRYGTKVIKLISDPTRKLVVPDIKSVISALSKMIDELKKRHPDWDQPLRDAASRETKTKSGGNSKGTETLAISDQNSQKSKA